jgi:hypothetical protein
MGMRWLCGLGWACLLAGCGDRPAVDSGEPCFDCEVEICVDGIDNDGDDLTDCADPECAGMCPEQCDDGYDNDGDGQVDCADLDCMGLCPEDCTDGRDNDGDLLTDCMDPECASEACAELCGDEQDNDGDGLTDCADPDCDGGCDEVCDDGRDNDGDQATDCDDPECDGQCPEACDDTRDNDGDGAVDCADADCDTVCDLDGDGFLSIRQGGADCDDTEAAAHPGAAEVCDGVDNDCNGLADDDDDTLILETRIPWYQDGDGDGFGNPDVWVLACKGPAGTVDLAFDCDDSSDQRHPFIDEVCDGIDNDCDSTVDDDDLSLDVTTGTWFFTDADGDGVGDAALPLQACALSEGLAALEGDCDDADPSFGLPEPWWEDGDGDGFGRGEASSPSCTPPTPAHVLESLGEDCHDGDPSVYPGAEDACGDGVDHDCDGEDAPLVLALFEVDGPLDDCSDLDGDGLVADLEVAHGSDPLIADTDGDSMPDGWEVLMGLDPAWMDGQCLPFQEHLASADVETVADVVLADIDGDGEPDMVSTQFLHLNSVVWHQHIVDGVYGVPRVIDTGFWLAESVVAADLDGDGDVDVVASDVGDHDLWWYENLGAGTFSAGVILHSDLPGMGELAVVDVDGDGREDVVAQTLHSITWFPGLGGAFGGGRTLELDETCFGMVWSDDDGDGDADLVVAGDTLVRFENRGDGTFRPPVRFGPPYQSVLASGDVDGDGDRDLVSAGLATGQVGWQANLGDGTFGEFEAWFEDGRLSPTRLGLADLDEDGSLDVVYTSSSPFDPAFTGVFWLRNAGGGAVDRPFAISRTVENPTALALGDANQDGTADAVVGDFSTDSLIWYAHPTRLDGDGDGLTDDAEICVVGTDETLADTDADGLDDGDELLGLSNPFDPASP